MPILTKNVPGWTLMLMTALALVFGIMAWSASSENRALKEDVRAQEDRVPGFLSETSILSEEATCRRNPFVRLKDSLIGSDSCRQGF